MEKSGRVPIDSPVTLPQSTMVMNHLRVFHYLLRSTRCTESECESDLSSREVPSSYVLNTMLLKISIQNYPSALSHPQNFPIQLSSPSRSSNSDVRSRSHRSNTRRWSSHSFNLLLSSGHFANSLRENGLWSSTWTSARSWAWTASEEQWSNFDDQPWRIRIFYWVLTVCEKFLEEQLSTRVRIFLCLFMSCSYPRCLIHHFKSHKSKLTPEVMDQTSEVRKNNIFQDMSLIRLSFFG